eukprot:6187981-Pleurochrysis_carterae.AAC.4
MPYLHLSRVHALEVLRSFPRGALWSRRSQLRGNGSASVNIVIDVPASVTVAIVRAGLAQSTTHGSCRMSSLRGERADSHKSWHA